YAGVPAYRGMEIQILDDTAPQYAQLRPGQFNGAIYDVVAAKRGALKPVGEWYSEEIIGEGSKMKLVLNRTTVVNANLDDVTDPAVLHEHPGLKRKGGHIGLLSHEDYVEFRNIRIKQLPERP